MDLIALLLLGLATWRLSHMLVGEDGPWFAFYRLRRWAGIEHDEDRHVFKVPERFLPMVLSCVWCASVWVSAGWVVFWLLAPAVALPVAAWFAVSAVASGVNGLLSRQMV